jgi:hypothetical protein
MNTLLFAAAVLFAGVSIAMAWRYPRYAFLPSSVLLLVGLLQLWGMTEAMPRKTMDDLPPTLEVEARAAYSHGSKLSDITSSAFYRGIFGLAHRQRAFAAPALLVSLLGVFATQTILSLKSSSVPAATGREDTR